MDDNNSHAASALDVPAELRAHFTQDQMDELVSQFQASDVDGSGSIDEQEFRQLLTRMSLVVSDAEASDLVASIDVDGNGLIDFPELVSMVVRIKQGDGQFSALKKFLESLETTPISLLQREADKFGVGIAYQLLEEKPGTASTPAMFLVELRLSGKWCGPTGIERLQAIGKSTREAKFKVAEAGLVRMKKLKPGLAYDLGFLPPEWDKWLFDNLDSGGKASKIMQTLREKGFSPANNALLMQKISTRISSRRLRTKRDGPRSVYDRDGEDMPESISFGDTRRPTPAPTKATSSNRLDPQWVHWCQKEAGRGISGRTILEELETQGYKPEKNPSFTQNLLRMLKNRDDSASNGPSASSSRPFSFWNLLEDGKLDGVELFVFGGQDVDVYHESLKMAPLHIVCKHGHIEIVKFLVQQGALVNSLDAFHRTPLLIAARHGFGDICGHLLRHGASIFAMDNLSNTPLHMAAFSGSSSIACQILRVHDDRFRVFLARLPQQTGRSYEMIVEQAYEFVMRQKLRDNERRRFNRSWLLEAGKWVHDQLFNSFGMAEALVPPPQKFFIDYLIDRYSGELSKRKIADLGEAEAEEEDEDDTEQKPDDPALWLSLPHMTFYIDRCLRQIYKHLPNKQGRTALHIACDENLVCTHERVIHLLAERHGCSPHILDYSGSQPLELVLSCRGRPGSPRGDIDHEKRVIKAREARALQRQTMMEAERVTARRKEWQETVESMASDFNDLDTLTRAKAAVKEHLKSDAKIENFANWNVYAESWSRNRLFENERSGFVQRQVPAKVADEMNTLLGWKEKLELYSRFVEKNRLVPEWEVHRVNGTDIYFFFNSTTSVCQWVMPKEAPTEWRTKRIFEDEEQFLEEPDRETLTVRFSGKLSSAIMKDVVKGRTLGEWRECKGFAGATFYLNEATSQISIDKPDEVLRYEGYRYAHIRIRDRSESIEEYRGGWQRYYDPTTAHTFFFDDISGECVHDTFATAEFLAGIRKPRRKPRFALSKEELQRRLEEKEWKAALERARRHERLVKQEAAAKEDAVKQRQEQDAELDEAIRQLEMSVTSEHLEVIGGEADPRKQGKDLAYIDARFKRELDIFLDARKHHLLTSTDPSKTDPHNEIDRSLEFERNLDEQELENARVEDTDEKASIRERRRVSRILVRALERHANDRELCRWGCERWLPRIQALESHERLECERRLKICRLGCGLVAEQRKWQKTIYDHESEHREECNSRIVACPRDCGVWVPHLLLDLHMRELCVKRPVGDLPCRLGCGTVFTGGAHELLALEQGRSAHEQDDCELRKVECTWPKCRAVIQAKERNAHRRTHLIASGIVSFVTAETHEYKVPKDAKTLKVQVWGAGGGSGLLRGQSVGHGGGGAFVEGICRVNPGETLYISIGAGGGAGQFARMVEREDRGDGTTDNNSGNRHGIRMEVIVSASAGGAPGGGEGHSGNKESACGGGGGFTAVYRQGAFGIEYLVIAGGGGGGGTCRHGGGGGLCKPSPLKEGADSRCGRVGGDAAGGKAGECDSFNPFCKFNATDGSSMTGGNGAEFGGGGGSGLFGGGGGGFAPGIVGGGGGGSSYVNASIFEPKSVRVKPGEPIKPGGMRQNPPQSVRTAYWDTVDGVAGEGGTGSTQATARGNHGAVRLARPGFFDDMKHHR